MVQPNLLNKILIEIEQIDESRTSFSNRRREPVNYVKRKQSFKIDGQIIFVEDPYLGAAKTVPEDRELAGKLFQAVGYVVVRKNDLKILGKELAIGDKIKSYGNVGNETQCEFYLLGKKDGGQYSDKGSTTLEKWFFEDRK